MARFIPKQFAENSTTSVVFGSFQEQGGNVGDGTISSDPATLQGGTAWPLGWSAATDNFFQIPRGEEMEGLERVLSAAIIQQFKDGLTFWQSEMPVTQYQTIVQYQTGSDLPKLYINITGLSTSTPPDSDTTNWYMFFDTGTPYANVDLSNLTTTGNDKFVTKDTAQTISAVKTFSAVPVMTGTLNAKDNSTNIPTTAWVRNHCATTAATTTSTASKDAPAYVVENYKSGNNWYRKWSDGWIEQGGILEPSTGQTVTLNKPFTTTKYQAFTQTASGTYASVVNAFVCSTSNYTTTTFFASCAVAQYQIWFACGY